MMPFRVLIAFALLLVGNISQADESLLSVTDPPTPLGDGTFPGEIRMFAGPTCPDGWLEAKGQTLRIEDYNDPAPARKKGLWNAIGNLWGAPDAASFNVPDLRGVFVRGWDHGRGADPDVNLRVPPAGAPVNKDQVGTTQPDEFKSHHHGISDPGHSHGVKAINGIGTGGNQSADTRGHAPNLADMPTKASGTGIAVQAAGGQETRPKNAYVLFCVRAPKKP